MTSSNFPENIAEKLRTNIQDTSKADHDYSKHAHEQYSSSFQNESDNINISTPLLNYSDTLLGSYSDIGIEKKMRHWSFYKAKKKHLLLKKRTITISQILSIFRMQTIVMLLRKVSTS